MNCDCIEQVNARLKEAGYSYELAPSLILGKKVDVVLAVETKWINPPKRSKAKPPSIICTYCPFCGKETRKEMGKKTKVEKSEGGNGG